MPDVDNMQIVSELLGRGLLRSTVDPSALPEPIGGRVAAPDRVSGMLIGLAIGDSLGNTSESQNPASRHERHGEIRDYLPNRHAGGQPVGLPSDDSQLAFWTLEHLLEHGRLIPDQLAKKFASRQIFGMGATVHAFLREFQRTKDWLAAKQESAGNGALMRIAPVLLPHLGRPSRALWADALLAGAITHDDFASNASCVAFIAVLWDALHAVDPFPDGFWIRRFLEVARVIEGPEPRYRFRAPDRTDRPTTLTALLEAEVLPAVQQRRSVLDACNSWYSGAFLLETVPSVLFILERHGNDPEEAIVRAVNDTRDNDTIAAIVGAAVGAVHGTEALPARWRRGLLGRTGADDDGRIFEIIRRAERKWVSRGE